MKVDVNTLQYQVPGGMLSNLVSQLKQANKPDKLDEVLEEVPRVKKTQVIRHLLPRPLKSSEHRLSIMSSWANATRPLQRNSRVSSKVNTVRLLLPSSLPLSRRSSAMNSRLPIDPLISSSLSLILSEKKAAQYIEKDEDVLSYALFEQVATKFFESRKMKEMAADTARDYVNIHEIK